MENREREGGRMGRMAGSKSSRVATRCDTQININCRAECKGYLQQPSEAHMGCPIEHEIEEVEWQVGGSEGKGKGTAREMDCGIWHARQSIRI